MIGVSLLIANYRTVKGYGEYEMIIQKSKFLTYINRVTTETEAQEFIQDIKKQHWNATHNCYAYIIGENDQIQKANDDGEPSGTAGVPILEVLKKNKLKDTVVVVTRYFGGIKLGAGGLIRAYGKSASEGLIATGMVQRNLMRVIRTSIEYTLLGKVENELRNSPYKLKDIHYLDNVTIETFVDDNKEKEFINMMVELTNAKSKNVVGERVYLESLIQDEDN